MKESTLAFFPYGILAIIIGVLGGMNVWLSLLVWLVAGNYLFGTLAAVKDTAFSFAKAWWGFVENLGLFFVIAIGQQLAQALHTPTIRDVVIFAIIGYVGMKCAKNLHRLGIYIPKVITDNFNTIGKRGV